MPIKFKKHDSGIYFISELVGKITNAELINSYKNYFTSNEYDPNLHEFVDFTHADFSDLSHFALLELANLEASYLSKNGVEFKKSAAYVPYGNSTVEAIIYEVWSKDSPEQLKIFRDKSEAISWLIE